MTFEAALIVAVTALAGVVGVLWKWVTAQIRDLKAAHRECEEDRKDLRERLLQLYPKTCSRNCPERIAIKQSV